MRRFQWSLQRLLNVTIQRELDLRNRLLEFTRQIVHLRQLILKLRAAHRTLLGKLAEEELPRRLPRQEVFLRCADVDEERIRRLREQIAALQRERDEAMQRFLKVRSSRETLERRRREAHQQFLREQMKIEQAQLDEGAQVAFARNAIRERLTSAG